MRNFKIIHELGGRSVVGKKLRAAGYAEATPSNLYAWTKRKSMPTEIAFALQDMAERQISFVPDLVVTNEPQQSGKFSEVQEKKPKKRKVYKKNATTS